MYKAGFIGCGNMGGTLAAVAAKALGEGQVRTADLDPEKLSRLKEQFGTVPGTGEQVAEACRLVFLGVKPHLLQGMLEGIPCISPAPNNPPKLIAKSDCVIW